MKPLNSLEKPNIFCNVTFASNIKYSPDVYVLTISPPLLVIEFITG